VQVLDVIEQMFADIFKGIESECGPELKAVGEQYPFEPFVMKPMRFTFAEAIKVLLST
jgi:aspartyl/asparaginyl-tRNA synthetase